MKKNLQKILICGHGAGMTHALAEKIARDYPSHEVVIATPEEVEQHRNLAGEADVSFLNNMIKESMSIEEVFAEAESLKAAGAFKNLSSPQYRPEPMVITPREPERVTSFKQPLTRRERREQARRDKKQ